MKKINILQFLPYFPPHKGGVETISKELGKEWDRQQFGKIYNIITSFEQNLKSERHKIIFSGCIIGYKDGNIENLIIPSFEIINNYPCYKFWSKKFRIIKKYLKYKIKNGENYVVFTHTRFFLTSFFGGLFARKNKLKWLHIEHGSDYVFLSSKIKTKVAYVCDKIIGKWIFKNTDKIIAISYACKRFIEKNFKGHKSIELIYNGIKFNPGKKIDNGNIIKIGFVGRLVKLKGIDLLLKAFKNIQRKNKYIVLEIIGDGEELGNLKKLLEKEKIKNTKFLGFKNIEFIEKNFLPKIDIFVNPSYQEGLPTTVIEALLSSCVVVATDVGGTKEISNLEDLIIVKKGDLKELEKGIKKAILNYKQLVGKSSKNVKEKFNLEKNILLYHNLLTDL